MEISLRLFAFLNKIIGYLISPILYFIFRWNKKVVNQLPKIDNPILEICAVDLAAKIRNREVRNIFYHVLSMS